MRDPATFDENARHYAFLTAASIANVDGVEDDRELDALCQLRKTLGIAPTVARRLHQLACSATEFAPPNPETA